MMKNVVIVVLGLALMGAAFMIARKEPVTPVNTHLPVVEAPVENRVCAQVITPAVNPETGDIVEFPTPCDVPKGWEPVQNDIPDLDLEVQ